jgi:hypothetical protein
LAAKETRGRSLAEVGATGEPSAPAAVTLAQPDIV